MQNRQIKDTDKQIDRHTDPKTYIQTDSQTQKDRYVEQIGNRQTKLQLGIIHI